jgi:methylenetetrahydrofolate dehydrogenase (NADP+)/methenyltetrahydrofolate cyclohydrolase
MDYDVLMQIIDGRALAKKIKDGIVKEILDEAFFCPPASACACGHDHGHNHAHDLAGEEKTRQARIIMECRRPNLAIILAGEREDSRLYVGLKEREAKKVGIDTHLYKLDTDVSEAEFLGVVDYLNNDGLIDAILVQLPLPEHLDADKIIAAVDPAKDVDGFHPENLKTLAETGRPAHVMPVVYEVVLEMLKSIKYTLKGEQALVIANSGIFGQGLVQELKRRGAKAGMVFADNPGLAEKTRTADLLVTAAGRPKLINGRMIKKGAVLIDVGISKADNQIVGDIDPDDISDTASFLTPVPGGVGPMTIAVALRNVLKLHKERCKNK